MFRYVIQDGKRIPGDGQSFPSWNIPARSGMELVVPNPQAAPSGAAASRIPRDATGWGFLSERETGALLLQPSWVVTQMIGLCVEHLTKR